MSNQKTCVLCDQARCRDNKFCRRHLGETIREMERSRYLTTVPRRTERPHSAREDIYSTKFGRTG